MRRWIISASPVSSEQTMYLPRRPMEVIVAPVNPSISCWREVRRTVRSRPTSTRSIRRPTTNETMPRRTVSTSGSSGTIRWRGQRVECLGRSLLFGELLRLALADAKGDTLDEHGRSERLGMIRPCLRQHVDGGRVVQAGGQLLQHGLVVQPVQLTG